MGLGLEECEPHCSLSRVVSDGEIRPWRPSTTPTQDAAQHLGASRSVSRARLQDETHIAEATEYLVILIESVDDRGGEKKRRYGMTRFGGRG